MKRFRMKYMNKCFVIMMILLFCVLSGCGNRMTTQRYDNEEILGIEIIKTEAYLDKFVLTFADDSVSDVEKVEIDYYDNNLSVVEEIPTFSYRNDVLTVETDHASDIYEIRIWEKDRDVYFYVRYLYSDAYVMLVYSWADDAGYLVNGDEDAFYTEEEKEYQRQLEEASAEAEAYAFSSIRGEWISEDGTMRIIFDIDEDYQERYFSACKQIDSEWVEYDSMVIEDISPYGDNSMALYDDPSFGRQVEIELIDDNSMIFDYTEEVYHRVN